MCKTCARRLTRVPPRRNHLDARLEAVKGELESDLVVTLAGASVRDIVASLALGDLDHATGDDGAGERSAKQVDALVDCVDLDGGCTRARTGDRVNCQAL